MSVSPPRIKGPPLNSLRAFEAAARLGSFSIAADELCVTPGAVAQHIKALEAWTEKPLFLRHAQGVELTELGKEILPKFITAFDHLGEAIHSLRSKAAPQHLKIAALPSIAQLWLTPKLPLIRAKLPDVRISITALETPPNLLREPYDISIFFKVVDEKFNEIIIDSNNLFPVCIPKIAENLTCFKDMGKYDLLHDSLWLNDWQDWLGEFSLSHKIDIRGPVYSLYSLAVEEALNGAGILMAHEALVKHHLKSGALVAPFKQQVRRPEKLVVSVANTVQNSALLSLLIAAFERYD